MEGLAVLLPKGSATIAWYVAYQKSLYPKISPSLQDVPPLEPVCRKLHPRQCKMLLNMRIETKSYSRRDGRISLIWKGVNVHLEPTNQRPGSYNWSGSTVLMEEAKEGYGKELNNAFHVIAYFLTIHILAHRRKFLCSNICKFFSKSDL